MGAIGVGPPARCGAVPRRVDRIAPGHGRVIRMDARRAGRAKIEEVGASHNITRTAELAGYSPVQVKRIWVEVSKDGAERTAASQRTP